MNRARARARRLAAASLASWLALAGCSAARTVPDADRHSLARAWEGKLVYLRSSVNVLPFHADASRRLVTPLHLDSIVPVSDGQGRPVPVGPVEAVVPPIQQKSGAAFCTARSWVVASMALRSTFSSATISKPSSLAKSLPAAMGDRP